jgi:hypothetical protein
MLRLARLLPLIAFAALSVSACAPGDVELNGKIFDAVGIGTGSVGQRKAPQLAERAPLVLPPSLERLPQPDASGGNPQAAAFPIDPEKRSAMSASALQQQQAAYCKEHYEKQIALGNRTQAETAKGPLGMCAPSALQSLTGSNPLIQRQ